MANKTDNLELPDGRSLGYQEFGDPEGTPVFYFHGWPACGLEAMLYEPAASATGARLISTDRPGFGASTFQPNRTLLDWPDDVAQLADHLGLDTFRIMGHSGGGPYAAACAYKIPDRIAGATVVAGLSPMNIRQTREGMRPMNQFLLSIGKWCPWILGRMMRMTAKMSKKAENLMKGTADLPQIDRDLIEQHLPDIMAALEVSFQQGAKAATQEGVIYAKSWGFELSQITIPVEIWQGSLDVNVPLSNGQLYKELIPQSKLNLIEGQGHFSLAINCGEQMFASLVN